MQRRKLEVDVARLVQDFAMELIEAVKKSSLAELAAIKGGAGPGPKPAEAEARATGGRRRAGGKRRKFNYPKCKIEGCGRNRYARGQGFCGLHFKEYEAGKIDLGGNPKK